MEQQLSAGLGEGEISELIEDDQVAPAQLIGGALLVAGPRLFDARGCTGGPG